MKVLFVTSECVPFFKLGGLGDVSYALPVALSRLGVQPGIALPYYSAIKVDKPHGLGPLAVDIAGRRELVFIFTTTIPETRIPVYLFRHPRFTDYHGDDLVGRFAFFAKAAANFVIYASGILGLKFDVVHCQDWHAALVPVLLGENNKLTDKQVSLQSRSCKTILTIHNLLYQGQAGLQLGRELGVPARVWHLRRSHLGWELNLLREGIERADLVTTVSPTYAREILTTEYGAGLGEVLNKRKANLLGIINGIDETIWNPANDPNLPVNYTGQTVTKAKAEIKRRLQRAVGLPIRQVPLFGFVGRLELRQKGIDILAEAVELLRSGAGPAARVPHDLFQLVVLGTGDGAELMSELGHTYKNITFINTFDERLARRIYAGADVMLVPSKFEPCGLTQMIAMRYGTVPLVRKTGGLADTVKHGKTGFVFDKYNGKHLADMMMLAIEYYDSNPREWASLVRRVMAVDFSWAVSAREYLKTYKKLLNTP